MSQPFSIKPILTDSWGVVRKDLKFFALLAFIAWLIQFIPSYINNQLTNTTAGFIMSLVSWVVNSAVTVGLIAITLKYLRSGKASFSDAMVKLNRFSVYLLGSIYYSLIVLVGIILLVIPGILWAIRYQFYGYLIIDQGLKPKEALAKSKEMTQGKTGKLFLFGLALLGVNLLGVLCLGVGLLVTIPISLLSVARVYEQLSGKFSAVTPAGETNSPKSNIQNPTVSPAANVWKNFRQN